jgi:hypothetical protein
MAVCGYRGNNAAGPTPSPQETTMTNMLKLTGTLTGAITLLAMTSTLAPAQAGQGHGYGRGYGYHISYKKPLYVSVGHGTYYNHSSSHQPRYYKTCAKWAYGHCAKW